MNLYPFADYAKKETERVKNELPKKGKGALRFACIADLHYKYNDEMRVSVSNIVHAVNELNKSEKIDFFCLGGDNVGNYPASREEHLDMMRELASLLSQCDVPVIFVQGNHDENSIHGRIAPDSNVCHSGFEVRDKEQYDIMFSLAEKSPLDHVGGKDALYGYFDAPHTNTRVIFLNSSDVPYIVENGILIYNQQWYFGYREEQLSWLCDTALKDAPDNVIFIQHLPFDMYHPEEEDIIYNRDVVNDITKAFVRGGSGRFVNAHEDFGYCLSADFGGKPHRVFRIGGHCHRDFTCVDEIGLLSVTTMLAGRKCSGMNKPGDDGVVYDREPFTVTETSMDIFTIDPEENLLTANRYGCGRNRKSNV